MKKCPKCSYERQQKDDEFYPITECPKCGIIYDKFTESLRFDREEGEVREETKDFTREKVVAQKSKKPLLFISLAVVFLIGSLSIFLYLIYPHIKYPQKRKYSIDKIMMLANEMCEYIEALTSIVEETDEFEKKERINISSLPNSTPSDKDSKNLIEFYVQQVKQARRAGLEKIDNVLKTSGIKKSIEENNKKIQEEINTLKNPPENYVKAHGGLLLFHTKYTDFTNFVLNPLDETDLSSYHFKFLMNKEMIGIAYIFFLDSILDAYEDELPRTEETRRARDFAQKLKSHAENNDTSHSSDIK